MTSPSGMSCETCRDLLIELVCDELSAEMAAAVRAHALKCERCGPELEKLDGTLKASSALPLLAPSPEVERRIMQAAREAMAGRARGPAREAAPAASYGLTAWFAKLGSFAMSPQVAMASVLLLVVGIGLYALPFGSQSEPSALRVTEDESESESESDNAAASPAASATATPLAQPDAEERAEHGIERKEQARRPMKSAAPEPQLEGATAKGRARRAGESERLEAEPPALGKSAQGSGVGGVRAFPGSKAESASSGPAKPKAAAKAAPRESKALSDDFDGFEASGNAAPSAPAPSVFKDRAQPADLGSARAAGGYAPAPPSAAAAPQAAPAVTASGVERVQGDAPRAAEAELASEPSKSADKRSKSDISSALERGIAAVRRGDHTSAEALLKPLASGGAGSDRTTAMLWLARSLRERGDCVGALAYYRVLTQAVTAARAVLEEAADCHARTGNKGAAEKLRARAALPAKN